MSESFDYWQGVHAGKIKAAEKIIEYLTERADDIRTCHDNDSCADLVYYTDGIIEDIRENYLPQEPFTDTE